MASSFGVISETQVQHNVSNGDVLHFNYPVYQLVAEGYEKCMDCFSVVANDRHEMPLRADGKWNMERFSEKARFTQGVAISQMDRDLESTNVPLLPTINFSRIEHLNIQGPIVGTTVRAFNYRVALLEE